MLSKVERCWLVGIRLAWRFRADSGPAERLIDSLLQENGLKPAGCCLIRLIHALQAEGATHLYIERLMHPEPTGDEHDLLATLRCCYLDDTLSAENALGALLPPGAGLSALRAANDIALAHRLNMPCSRSFSFDWPRWMHEDQQPSPASPNRPGLRLEPALNAPAEPIGTLTGTHLDTHGTSPTHADRSTISSRPQDPYARPETPIDRHIN